MIKIAWCTDIHLNFIDKDMRNEFYQKFIDNNVDQIWITGDIGEFTSTLNLIKEMEIYTKCKVYYVLGNHDFYDSSISVVKDLHTHNMGYLDQTSIRFNNFNVILTGCDGFYDLGYGNYSNSFIRLNDFNYIEEFHKAKKKDKGYDYIGNRSLKKEIRTWSVENTNFLIYKLKIELKVNSNATYYILTHVPPFKECSMFEGHVTGDEYLPFYCNKNLGVALKKLAKEYNKTNFVVLCGHTHNKCEKQILPNLLCKVGRAQYYKPEIQEVFEI